MEVTDKEFAVIAAIHSNDLQDQRTIAVRAGISLGMANLLIKRLIKKVYIKAKQLNQKKIQYLLTPKGFSEKANKSYLFTQKTITVIRSIKHRLHELILEKHEKGITAFAIVGNNEELSDIMEILFHNLSNLSISYTMTRIDANDRGLFLKYRDPITMAEEKIDLIEYLSNTGMFYQ